MPKVVIVGAGVVGLSCAHYLRKARHDVLVIDRNNFGTGCSYGNGGMVVPSHFTPLAAPGMVAYGLRRVFNPRSPFGMSWKPSKEMLDWGWRFLKSSTPSHVDKASPALAQLNLLSKRLYKELAADLEDFGFAERGMLILCAEPDTLRHEFELADKAENLGIASRKLSLDEAKKVDPEITMSAAGAVFYPEDSSLLPQLFLQNFYRHLQQSGVQFKWNCSIDSVVTQGNEVKGVRQGEEVIEGDIFVFAAGAWTGRLLREIGNLLPLVAGKGYSFDLAKPPQLPRVSAILTEARVAVTPMGGKLRFAGTMEIAAAPKGEPSINAQRVQGIRSSIAQFYPKFPAEVTASAQVWAGLRPLTPDGVPYMGKLSQSNAYAATGHAMMGMSLGPATGKVIQGMIDGEKCELDQSLFDPLRFA